MQFEALLVDGFVVHMKAYIAGHFDSVLKVIKRKFWELNVCNDEFLPTRNR